jgi:hypothetical protein
MKLFALLLLLQHAEESIRERVLRLAKDPMANRQELLAIGPAAIRPLLENRVPEIEPRRFDL